MRPIMEMETAEEASRNVIHLSPSRAPTPCNPHIHNCRWWPYSSSNEFGANTAVIIIILLCALICALVLNTAIRCFLRSSNSRRHPPDRLPQTQRDGQLQKPNCMAGAAPLVMATTLVYSAGMKLRGAEAEDAADCAICLSEFEEGEGIRVLGSCKHGFHTHCIEQWLFSHSSCPICRRSCLASSPSLQQNVDCCSGNGENESSQQHVEPE